MKKLFPTLAMLLLGALVLFSGCQRRPERPNPGQTMMGPGAGTASMDLLAGDDLFFGADDAAGLTPRDPRAGSIADIGERGVLPNVFFDFDSSAIRPGERGKLTQVADFMRNNPRARILLEGHCDWRGTTEYNLGLGDRRARSVRSFLESLGVAAERMETLSKGDLEAVEGGTEEQMQFDRRVEVVVLR